MTHRDLVAAIADLFLGRTCSGCAQPGTLLCTNCTPFLLPEPEIHEYLIHTGYGWLPAAHALTYRGVVRTVLFTYKDHRVPELSRVLSPALASAISALREHANLAPTVRLVPIPSRASALRRRGFDPTRVLLDRVQRAEHLPRSVVAHWLIDQRGSGASKRLGRTARVRASKDAFRTSPRIRPGTEVILIDDIITTGSTVSEAARTLELAGVSVRGVAAIAYTR